MRLVQAATMLLGAAMYGFVFAFSRQLSSSHNFDWNFFIVGFWNTLLIVVSALVVVDCIRKVRVGETRALATGAFVVKLAAVPFFVLNFLFLAYLAAGGLLFIIFGGVVLLVAFWIGIGLTYLAMLSTSIYLWAAIARLRRDRVIGTGLAVLYTFLSFVFLTDVVAGVVVFGHSRRRPGLALVIVLLALGMLVAAPGFLASQLEQWYPIPFVDYEGLSVFALIGTAIILGTIVIAVVRWAVLRRRSTTAQTPEIAE